MSAREYYKISEKYGDIVHLNVLTQSIILLGSYRAVSDLFDKRSANYSDRPHFMMPKLVGADCLAATADYGEPWRRRRKEFQRFLGPSVISKYAHLQAYEGNRLAELLLRDPDGYAGHVRFCFGSTILRVVYGIDISSPDDEYLKLEDEAMAIVCDVSAPGKYLVEIFPFLQYLPSWFPGAGHKTVVDEYRAKIQEAKNKPFDAALQMMHDGNMETTVIRAMVDKEDGIDDEGIARDVCGEVYLAAADTLVSSFYSFIYAIAANPEAQKRAQAELDAVVGPDRPPLLSDRTSLPYVQALAWEVYRMYPAVHLGVPHSATADDEYEGYHIPKGSILIANPWAIGRDPEAYTEPDCFMPERFLKEDGQLNPDVRSPRSYVFGFGRRICPGLHFGDAAFFITVACVLHALTIEPPCDAEGRPVVLSENNVKMKDGFLTYPELLAYRFTPRSSSKRKQTPEDIS